MERSTSQRRVPKVPAWIHMQSGLAAEGRHATKVPAWIHMQSCLAAEGRHAHLAMDEIHIFCKIELYISGDARSSLDRLHVTWSHLNLFAFICLPKYPQLTVYMHGYRWTSNGGNGSPWIANYIHGYLCTSLDIHGYQKKNMDIQRRLEKQGCIWNPIHIHGYPRILMHNCICVCTKTMDIYSYPCIKIHGWQWA